MTSPSTSAEACNQSSPAVRPHGAATALKRAGVGLAGAILSGICLALAQSQIDNLWPWPLLALAWVPLLATLPGSALGAWLLGGLTHLLMMTPLLGGVAAAVGLELGFPVMLCVAALCALPLAAHPALQRAAGPRVAAFTVLGTLVLLDALRARSWVSWVGLGDALGESGANAPFLAVLGLGGCLLLLAALNVLWLEAWRAQGIARRAALGTLAALGSGLPLLWASAHATWSAAAHQAPRTLRVALVAPGLPAGEADGDTFKVDRLLQAYRQLDHTEVDLVLMPQSSMNGLSPSDPDLRQELLAQVDRQGIPLLAGSELRLPDHRWDRPHQYNAAFLASPPSRLTGTSDIPPPVQWQAKRRPVPWTEFWPEPFRRLPLGGLEQRVAPYIPGNGSTPLKLDTPSGPTSLGVMLCYDAYNPGIASDLQTQGAKLLLVLSSDESFSGSALSRQGLRVARIRGMSLGLPTLRVAWSRAGTGAYDGHGRPLPPRQLQRPVPGVTLWHVPIT